MFNIYFLITSLDFDLGNINKLLLLVLRNLSIFCSVESVRTILFCDTFGEFTFDFSVTFSSGLSLDLFNGVSLNNGNLVYNIK